MKKKLHVFAFFSLLFFAYSSFAVKLKNLALGGNPRKDSLKVNWEKKQKISKTVDIKSVSVQGKKLYAETFYDFFLVSENGNKFEPVTDKKLKHSGYGGFVGFGSFDAPVRGNTIYMPSSKQGIIMSTDNKKTWKPCNKGLDCDPDSVYHVEKVIVFENSVYAAVNSDVYYLADNSDTWIKSKGEANYELQTIELDKKNEERRKETLTEDAERLKRAESYVAVIRPYFTAITEMKFKLYDKALSVLNNCLKQKPDFTEALTARAECYTLLNQTDKAAADKAEVEKLKLDVKPDPLFETMFGDEREKANNYCSGQYYSNHQEANDADGVYLHANGGCPIDKFDKLLTMNTAIKLDPSQSRFYDVRAETYTSMGKLELALADYDKAHDMDPSRYPKWEIVKTQEDSVVNCKNCGGTGRVFISYESHTGYRQDSKGNYENQYGEKIQSQGSSGAVVTNQGSSGGNADCKAGGCRKGKIVVGSKEVRKLQIVKPINNKK